jgi:hypothetical protein
MAHPAPVNTAAAATGQLRLQLPGCTTITHAFVQPTCPCLFAWLHTAVTQEAHPAPSCSTWTSRSVVVQTAGLMLARSQPHIEQHANMGLTRALPAPQCTATSRSALWTCWGGAPVGSNPLSTRGCMLHPDTIPNPIHAHTQPCGTGQEAAAHQDATQQRGSNCSRSDRSVLFAGWLTCWLGTAHCGSYCCVEPC